MTERLVIGLFHTRGTAEDVCNRLKSAAVPQADIRLEVLHQSDPLPPTMAAERRGYGGDPFFGGFILKKWGDLITNGETAVSVTGRSDSEAEDAVTIMRQFTPIAIELMDADEAAQFLADERAKPRPA